MKKVAAAALAALLRATNGVIVFTRVG